MQVGSESECESCNGEGRVWNNADPTSGQFHECECVADCFALTDAALAQRVRSYASTCTGLEPRRILQLAAERLERGGPRMAR